VCPKGDCTPEGCVQRRVEEESYGSSLKSELLLVIGFSLGLLLH
jgi:hypothetical protein